MPCSDGRDFSAESRSPARVWPARSFGRERQTERVFIVPVRMPTLWNSVHSQAYGNMLPSSVCAELVAACLQVGGLLSPSSKPGAATPSSLYRMYKSSGAAMANPCTLRREFGKVGVRPYSSVTAPLLGGNGRATQFSMPNLTAPSRGLESSGDDRGTPRRSDSPPRMQFKVVQPRGSDPRSMAPVTLSLSSLSMNRTKK